MSKKHKKHHKSEKSEKSSQEDKPLKIVLKVGVSSDTPDSIVSEHSERKHKHKKKKKKNKSSDKDKDRERHHHKHDKYRKEKACDEDSILEASDEGKGHSYEEALLLKSEEKPTVEKEKLVKETIEKKERPSRKREMEKDDRAEGDHSSKEPPAKKALFGEEHEFVQHGRSQRQKEEKTVLQKSLEYLHNILQRKDVNAFFSYPVTDSIAPGYSSIIKEPMDFSTMKSKIDNNEYKSIIEYRRDLNLMCNNCMVYNQPETIFYKEAARIMGMGGKQLSKEKLLQMRKNLPLMTNLTDEELGLDQEEQIDVEGVDDVGTPGSSTPVRVNRIDASKPKSTTKFEAIMDDMSPEEILAQAQAAAREAAVELTMRKPNSQYGFLRRRKDGTVTFNVLNPDNDGIVSEKERIVNLGKLTGKLTSGAGTLAGFREDKRNKATPVNYMNYGPFSSYAPTYDSSFATLSKEESDLLLSTYGDETGIQYAKSLKDFVSDSGEFATRIVDGLLDILTGNEHSKANKIFEEKRKEETEKTKNEKEEYEAKYGEKEVEETGDSEAQPTIDFKSLKSLSDIGIDMSFLEDYEKQALETESNKTEEERKIDEQLQNSAKLIGDLQKTQYERLSMKLPPHLAMVPGPSDAEKELANKVTTELTNLAKQVNPEDVVSVKAIRNAMGITYEPVEVKVEDETGETEQENNAVTERSTPTNASHSENGVVDNASEPLVEGASPVDETDLEGLMESPSSQENDHIGDQSQTDCPDDSSQEEMDTAEDR